MKKLILGFIVKYISLNGTEKAFEIAYEHGLKKAGHRVDLYPHWDNKIFKEYKNCFKIGFKK